MGPPGEEAVSVPELQIRAADLPAGIYFELGSVVKLEYSLKGTEIRDLYEVRDIGLDGGHTTYTLRLQRREYP